MAKPKTTAEKAAPKKAAPKKAPAAYTSPFKDGGLHLAVLSVLMDDDVFSEDKVERLLRGVKGRNEYELLQNGVKKLHALPLPAKHLAAITALDFDGGNNAYMSLEAGVGTETGGETDAYCLRSLEGITALTSLTTLDLDSHGGAPDGEQHDLAHLVGLNKLESLILHGSYVHAEALESLPSLQKLQLLGGTLDDMSVLDRLRARGVSIAGP
jgi:hypothetical protein